MSDQLSASAITALLAHPIAVQVMPSVDSTNSEAKRQIAQGLSEPLLLLAETQTGGRGRLGRAFSSPDGAGLYMSLVLHPDLSAERALSLTSAAAVAVCLAVESLTDLHPQIKWVNDVYIGGRKLCGILTEGITDPLSGRLQSVVVGVGINCRRAPLPDAVAAVATSLEGEGAVVDRNLLAAAICDRLIELYGNLSAQSWLPLYRARAWLDGKAVVCRMGDHTTEGIVLGIDDDGALLLATEEGTLRLFTGEATVRPIG
ncbi:MAG: biotin--[acetyl-CoA-carboxylase] ligase [Eubacteriales bacterium]